MFSCQCLDCGAAGLDMRHSDCGRLFHGQSAFRCGERLALIARTDCKLTDAGIFRVISRPECTCGTDLWSLTSQECI